MHEAVGATPRAWFTEVFQETTQLNHFLNTVGLEPAQVVSTHFALVSPNTWRILLTCWLTPEQDEVRRQWQATEAALRGRKPELPVGSAH
jgi:hypothetical protein